jgi:hypothetical protein
VDGQNRQAGDDDHRYGVKAMAKLPDREKERRKFDQSIGREGKNAR